MKKLIFAISIILLFARCDNLTTDLPNTDTNMFITGNTVTFPKGTKAVDIYNTVSSIYPDNEYHNITNGEWKYIQTNQDENGLITQAWQSVSFSKIKHTYSKHESGVNTYKVYLYTNDTYIKEIVYEWQRQTTNVWKNDIIEGDVTFTF